jgi:hypothetical protein
MPDYQLNNILMVFHDAKIEKNRLQFCFQYYFRYYNLLFKTCSNQ